MMKPPCSATNLHQLKSNSNVTISGITYSQQDQLPLLPIPDLEVTLQRFESRVQALLPNQEQQVQTKKDIQEFLHNDGPKLHEALCTYEENGRNAGIIGSYVEEFWNESYLQPDTSVVLNLNPFFVLEDSPDPKMAHDQIRRAAGLCYASIQMVSLIKLELLKPDMFRNQPLCMHQYKSLFASSRQPTLNDSDVVHVFNDSTHGMYLYFIFLVNPFTFHLSETVTTQKLFSFC
jgi:carnitine O-acetyltransferase